MLKDKLQESLKELYLAYERRWAIEKQIDTLKKESIEKNAIHKVGDTVEVYDENGKYFGDGVIASLATSLFIDVLNVKNMINKQEDALKSIETIRYEVLSLNKNGTPSKKHVFGSQHYFYDQKDAEEYSRYIKAK